MALHWDISKVNPSVKRDKNNSALTEALIFSTMFVEMGEITDRNYIEFYTHLHVYELLFGTTLTEDREPRYITFEEVKSYIGLRTNVSTKSAGAFWKKIRENFTLDIKRANLMKPQNTNQERPCNLS